MFTGARWSARTEQSLLCAEVSGVVVCYVYGVLRCAAMLLGHGVIFVGCAVMFVWCVPAVLLLL